MNLFSIIKGSTQEKSRKTTKKMHFGNIDKKDNKDNCIYISNISHIHVVVHALFESQTY
jgi:hypothetical protein